MGSVERKLIRKRKHSTSKCLYKQSKRFHLVKFASGTTDQETWSLVVEMMSHKDLKIVSADPEDFKELPSSDHFVSLVTSALLERAITSATVCAHEEQT